MDKSKVDQWQHCHREGVGWQWVRSTLRLGQTLVASTWRLPPDYYHFFKDGMYGQQAHQHANELVSSMLYMIPSWPRTLTPACWLIIDGDSLLRQRHD